MIVELTDITGLLLIKPKVFEDERGYFFENYSKKAFHDAGIKDDFVQENQSLSQKGVLRGLHFQAPPFAQSKLIRVIRGSVFDVVVDIRSNSAHYGQSFCVELNETNKWMLYVPEGFAHGFLTLEDNTIFAYKCGNYYQKDSEGGIMWNDDELAISWGVDNPILSEKDKNNIVFSKFKSPF
ncbi:MAG: dTDP-4-dehydrorhamnose 3,5-epimerase [Flavobacteriales bacterium]